MAARAWPIVTLSARRPITVVLRRPRPPIPPRAADRQEELAVPIEHWVADSRRQHANDRARQTIDDDCAADDRGIALIASAPRIERDDDDGCRSRISSSSTNRRPMNGDTCSTRNNDAETLGAKHLFGAGRPCHIEGCPVAHRQILEWTGVTSPIEIVLVGRSTRVRLRRYSSTMTSLSGRSNGSGLRSAASTTLKMMVLPAIPIASATTAAHTTAGARRASRMPCQR